MTLTGGRAQVVFTLNAGTASDGVDSVRSWKIGSGVLADSLISGDPPTKEAFLHSAMYEERPKAGAVVHLHSTHAVAVSCLADLDSADVLPPITAYYVMRVGRLPLVPFYLPGDRALAEAVRALAGQHHAVLLANHGPVVAGSSLANAVYAIEELEETAKLHLLLHGHKLRPLTPAQVAQVLEKFPS